jgi:hypothetical protein
MSFRIKKRFVLSVLIAFVIIMLNMGSVSCTTNIKLVVDGKDITNAAAPIIKDNRTLVPIRFVSEEIGAEVLWDEVNRTVSVHKENKSVFLKIDSRIVQYNNGESYQISDVAPTIINNRTYVPLRLISNALGIGIEWVEETRTVKVDSSKTSEKQPFYDVKIMSLESGDKISGTINISVNIDENLINKASDIRLLLLEKETGKGFVVARSNELKSPLIYVPKIEDKGEKILVAAIYDDQGSFIGGDVVSAIIEVKPDVSLKSNTNLGIVTGTLSLTPNVNFVAANVKYEFNKIENGKIISIVEQDPYGIYTWSPSFEQNGDYEIKVTAYDSLGNAYESGIYYATVILPRRLSLSGVTEGMIVNKPVSLIASRNFDVIETQYVVKDINTGQETILATIPYGSYSWFPGEEYKGTKELTVRVKDIYGRSHESSPVKVTIDGNPRIQLKGVGPNQVMTVNANLSLNSNVELESVKYILTNDTKGTSRTIQAIPSSDWAVSLYGANGDEGNVTLQAEALHNGKKIYSEAISFKIYLGDIYGAQPVIEKDKFLEVASSMATESWETTGMSATLQTAQAILETGWGQSVPVDKYTGNFSYNLFGIKGTGTIGSVISNTWEVYNGVSFRTDASFRAYRNIQESWDDHKNILLNLERYKPFREVMHDSTLGAYAIRRAGYATDPQYPIKLIRIINQYNLLELDKIGI